jgi:hypothetical protein
VVGDPPAPDREGGQPRPVARRQPREAQQLRRRGHAGEPAVVEEADPQPAPAHGQPQLARQGQHPVVRGRHRVVEAVDPDAAERRAPGQAAEPRLALVDRHVHPARGEQVREPEPEQPPADDADAAHARARTATCRAIRRA